ncbi:MAG: alginate lyase family protein [Legionella sp.]|nr:alginate lyase family protein [Legionella sp.]
MNVNGLALLFHTGRHLKAKQIAYRIFYYFYKCSRTDYTNANPKPRLWKKQWNAPLCFSSNINEAGQFTFLSEQGCLVTPDDWSNTKQSRLWLYNLHYFNELNVINANKRQTELNHLINKWIDENAVMQGCGWEPYPLSLRLVNLVTWFSRHPHLIKTHYLVSLATQAEALFKQLEYHILGNHLFANAKALIFIGTFLDEPRAEVWLKKGLQILDNEIKEQFLQDGGHFELSPMYHGILLWDLCDLVNLAQRSGLPELQKRQEAWQEVIAQGLKWLYSMLHPDNKISFFNDAAFGIAPEINHLEHYATQLNIPIPQQIEKQFACDWLSYSGYCAVYLEEGCKALIDIAPVGPNYQPGHAHADTLSFELSLYNQRFLVNSGTSQYGEDSQRHYERSTRAHNTVSINEENSSEIWAGFRVARRAYPKNRIVEADDKTILIAASHNGYKRLAGRNIHKREWCFTHKKLILKDSISGAYDVAISRLYFHPDVQLQIETPHLVHCVLLGGQKVYIKLTGNCQIKIEDTFWYPEFGVKIKNSCLVIQISNNKSLIELGW